MKYIRTKDNAIYKCPKDNYILVGSKEIYIDFEMAKQEGYKIADTIEELCDGFVGITTKEYPNRPDIEPSIHYFQKPFEFVYGNIEHLKLIDVVLINQNGWMYPTKEWFKDCDIYGFIRTDSGLKYVAKLDEKGELELL